MKKIIAAFDGLKYSESARDYAIALAKISNAHLVGVFMEDSTYTSYKIYDLVSEEGTVEQKLKKYDEIDKITRHNAAENFEKYCQQAGLEFTVHHDRQIAIRELKHESVYADLLVIDANETLTHYAEKIPTRFIRDLLSDAHCPVLVVPGKHRPIEKIVLLYDGEPTSVYAIKMFSYLLPQLKKLDTEVIAINPPNSTLHLPDNKLMKEFMKRHFPDVRYTVIEGWPEPDITRRIQNLQSISLVVLGAYKRSTVSRWFSESMADILMREVKVPLFIAHYR
jgi:nucleotide-binding universal stress UspA family protein